MVITVYSIQRRKKLKQSCKLSFCYVAKKPMASLPIVNNDNARNNYLLFIQKNKQKKELVHKRCWPFNGSRCTEIIHSHLGCIDSKSFIFKWPQTPVYSLQTKTTTAKIASILWYHNLNGSIRNYMRFEWSMINDQPVDYQHIFGHSIEKRANKGG